MEKENKKTLGRRKIQINKIQKKTSLLVTFSKRRRGLFRKASELCILCGARIAIVVQSPAQKIFTFGHPCLEAGINGVGTSPAETDDARSKYEEAMKVLEVEKRRMMKKKMIGGGFWWEEPFEGLELHELEEFLVALEGLRENVAGRVEEFHKVFKYSAACAPSIQQFSGGDSDEILFKSAAACAPSIQEFGGVDSYSFEEILKPSAAYTPSIQEFGGGDSDSSSYLSHPIHEDIFDMFN